MAEPAATEVPPTNGDVEMKEEVAAETPLSSIQQADPTDPNPPPQRWTEHTIDRLGPTEHLASIAPGVATPPTGATTRPGSMPPQPPARPERPVAHGGPTRQYLNTNVTPHLLEGMKYLVVYEPEKPLEWLSNFLKERSKEVEGATSERRSIEGTCLPRYRSPGGNPWQHALQDTAHALAAESPISLAMDNA
ncbi:hypothetical protein BST61_g3186 [Cercospora zeina]